jgi:hypothetical protein
VRRITLMSNDALWAITVARSIRSWSRDSTAGNSSASSTSAGRMPWTAMFQPENRMSIGRM